jgi:hypothetical protein
MRGENVISNVHSKYLWGILEHLAAVKFRDKMIKNYHNFWTKERVAEN